MKIASEAIHELLGHGSIVLIFGGQIADFYISILWPFELSHIDWVLPGETSSQTVWIIGGGVLVSSILSFLIQMLLLRKKSRWQLSVPLFWLSFWCYASVAGYLILGGISPFGDIQKLIQLGVLSQVSSIAIGVMIFLAGFITLSIILHETLNPFLGLNTKWAILAFWSIMPTLPILTAVGRGALVLTAPFAGFILSLLSHITKSQLK